MGLQGKGKMGFTQPTLKDKSGMRDLEFNGNIDILKKKKGKYVKFRRGCNKITRAIKQKLYGKIIDETAAHY